MTIDQMINVLQDAKSSPVIQQRSWRGNGDWYDCQPDWNFSLYEYRVKPEPREWWINAYPNGSTYAHDSYESARHHAIGDVNTVKVREVLE